MEKKIERRVEGESGSGNNSALNEYREFLPSEVQRESWSSRFVLFVENLSVSFDGFKAVDIPCLWGKAWRVACGNRTQWGREDNLL